MKVKEIYTSVLKGTLELDYCGHSVHNKQDDFLCKIKKMIDNANGDGDGKWAYHSNEIQSDIDQRMRNHFKKIINYDLAINDSFASICLDAREVCYGCGKQLSWVLNDGKLTLRGYYNPNKKLEKKTVLGEYGGQDVYDIDYRCPYEKIDCLSGHITVESKLIFSNFFREIEDAPEDLEYSDEYSLNYVVGRQNITKHKMTKNVAYGQMTNTSIGIYYNDTKDEIIIGPECHPAEFGDFESDKEYYAALKKPVFEGFKKHRKSICLDAWRWEATDYKTLVANNAYKTLVDQGKDMVSLVVPKGIWDFEHYYDPDCDDDSGILMYSKLWLRKS